MPEIMNCPLCGKEIDMSEEPIFCEHCGGNLLDVMAELKPPVVQTEPINDDRTVYLETPSIGGGASVQPPVVTPVDPISNEAEVVQSSAPEEFEKPSMSAPKTYHYVR